VPRQCCESLFSAPGVFFLAIFDLDPAKLSSIDVLFRASRNHRANEEHQNCRRYGNRNADHDINEHLSRSPMCLFCDVGDFHLLRSDSYSDSKLRPRKMNNPAESSAVFRNKNHSRNKKQAENPNDRFKSPSELEPERVPRRKIGGGTKRPPLAASLFWI
jgi:hypothetical protein